MALLRACYKSGKRFDEAYYVTKHLPLAASVFGPHGMKHAEMAKFTATPDGSPPVYQVIFSGYFDSPEALQAAMQSPRLGEVLADIANFYDGMPDVLIGEVVALPGA